jgi:hypothetical protein
MKFNSKRRPCCNILHGFDVINACDNCGTVVVEAQGPLKTVEVINSVKAQKAFECLEELRLMCAEDILENRWHVKILEKYGFWSK